MNTKSHIQSIAIVLSGLLIICGWGSLQDNGDREEIMPSVEMQEAGLAACAYDQVSVKEEQTADESVMEVQQEIPAEENGLLEIYADGERISVSGDIMAAEVLPQEILTGSPVIYNRFRRDGWVFEWLISDYHDENLFFLEDGVLVISRESNREDVQIIHVKAEGGGGMWVSVENKFEYVDVNYDGILDFLICTGSHGNQGALTYYCFLQTENGFVESPTFTDIMNPAIDAENELILSQWRNSAASHSWAEFQYQDNAYVMHRELREEILDAEENIWIWTVNGEVVGRSDELSVEEIEDLLYNENSEWEILGDRWQTLYNNGIMADYSIYDEP